MERWGIDHAELMQIGLQAYTYKQIDSKYRGVFLPYGEGTKPQYGILPISPTKIAQYKNVMFKTTDIENLENKYQLLANKRNISYDLKTKSNYVHPENKLSQFFTKIEPEIELLYQGIKNEVEKRKTSVFNAIIEDALNNYKLHKHDYELILTEDIQKSQEGFGTEKPSRDIKGRIMFAVAKRQMQNEFIDKTIPTNYQKLYDQYLTFKKKTKT